MSSVSITPYFPFCRVHIYDQLVTEGKSVIYVRPDKRYKPACYVCKSKCDTIHKWVKRSIRDLDFGPTHVSIECIYRQIFCTFLEEEYGKTEYRDLTILDGQGV